MRLWVANNTVVEIPHLPLVSRRCLLAFWCSWCIHSLCHLHQLLKQLIFTISDTLSLCHWHFPSLCQGIFSRRSSISIPEVTVTAFNFSREEKALQVAWVMNSRWPSDVISEHGTFLKTVWKVSVLTAGEKEEHHRKWFDRVRDGSVSDRGDWREEGQGCVAGFRSVSML